MLRPDRENGAKAIWSMRVSTRSWIVYSVPVSLHITQNGYAVLFLLVLAEALGLPVPAALALLIAGGSSAKGPLHLGFVLLTSVSALLLGDSLLFMLGRYTGWWLLGILCKLSLNPDSCILRSAESFRRRGRILLVVAKFVPGINSLAPPLAGSMNMRFAQFFPFDVGGALLYAVIWVGTGFLFSDFIAPLTNGYKVGAALSHGFWRLQSPAISVTNCSACCKPDRSATCRVFQRPKSLDGSIQTYITIWQCLTCAVTVITVRKLPALKVRSDWSRTRSFSTLVAYRKTKN